MIDSKVLRKYEIGIPVFNLAVNRAAQQAVTADAMRQAWFLSPKPMLIPEDVLQADPFTYQLTSTPDGTSLANLGSEIEQRAFLMKLGLAPPNEVVSLDAWVANEMRDLQQYDRTGTMQPTLASFMSLPPEERAWVARRGVDPPGAQTQPQAPPPTAQATTAPPTAIITPTPTPTPRRRRPPTARSLGPADFSGVFGTPGTLPGQSTPFPMATRIGRRMNSDLLGMEEARNFTENGTRSGLITTSPILRPTPAPEFVDLGSLFGEETL
jgi:hypothetical protein